MKLSFQSNCSNGKYFIVLFMISLSRFNMFFLIYSSDLMYVLTKLGYLLICQVKEKEKYVVLETLL